MEEGQFLGNFNCSDQGVCMAATSCDDMAKYLEPLSFYLGDHEFELSPDAYLVKGEAFDTYIGDTCIIGIQRLPEEGPQDD